MRVDEHCQGCAVVSLLGYGCCGWEWVYCRIDVFASVGWLNLCTAFDILCHCHDIESVNAVGLDVQGSHWPNMISNFFLDFVIRLLVSAAISRVRC